MLCLATPAFAQKSNVAPADEYFGRLKMSILGIGNVIRDMRLRVENDASQTASIFGSLALTEDAIRDWEAKYPNDSWIPRNLLALESCYLAANGERAREFAIRTEPWLQHDFPRTTYAFQARGAEPRSSLDRPVIAVTTARRFCDLGAAVRNAGTRPEEPLRHLEYRASVGIDGPARTGASSDFVANRGGAEPSR